MTMQLIDLKAILQHTVSSAYGDLVTRPTGKAVRDGIEAALDDLDTEPVTVIDFSTVRLLDYSCADEIVGKLLLEQGGARVFLLQGVTASHCEAIEPVLRRHKLAAIARDREGRVRMLGAVPEDARKALSALTDRVQPGSPADNDALVLPEGTAKELLQLLRFSGPRDPDPADRHSAGAAE
ncbi:MAG: hypothetical protein OEO20_13790 [Gemmatimonadota bacterium]|nr:hypothetical protein [Gemmatimonadota bacterium]MDH3367774.1 hypothetical protein [Gemmatimonadota bacterium]MDH3479363.1 hypothetical protein [Gemmatimonadota bacterium]MDH5550841.1 hypothetical protein [Gemmatimonadota bacterium]